MSLFSKIAALRKYVTKKPTEDPNGVPEQAAPEIAPPAAAPEKPAAPEIDTGGTVTVSPPNTMRPRRDAAGSSIIGKTLQSMQSGGPSRKTPVEEEGGFAENLLMALAGPYAVMNLKQDMRKEEEDKRRHAGAMRAYDTLDETAGGVGFGDPSQTLSVIGRLENQQFDIEQGYDRRNDDRIAKAAPAVARVAGTLGKYIDSIADQNDDGAQEARESAALDAARKIISDVPHAAYVVGDDPFALADHLVDPAKREALVAALAGQSVTRSSAAPKPLGTPYRDPASPTGWSQNMLQPDATGEFVVQTHPSGPASMASPSVFSQKVANPQGVIDVAAAQAAGTELGKVVGQQRGGQQAANENLLSASAAIEALVPDLPQDQEEFKRLLGPYSTFIRATGEFLNNMSPSASAALDSMLLTPSQRKAVNAIRQFSIAMFPFSNIPQDMLKPMSNSDFAFVKSASTFVDTAVDYKDLMDKIKKTQDILRRRVEVLDKQGQPSVLNSISNSLSGTAGAKATSPDDEYEDAPAPVAPAATDPFANPFAGGFRRDR